MKYLVLVVALLAGCTPFKAVRQEGPVENGSRPQLIEQCKTQPQLDWCQNEH